MMDKPEDIMRKFKRAVTDCETAVRYDRENKPGVSNLLTHLLRRDRQDAWSEAEAEFAGQGYGVFKPAVGEAVVELMRPIREETENACSATRPILSPSTERARRRQRIWPTRRCARYIKRWALLPADGSVDV